VKKALMFLLVFQLLGLQTYANELFKLPALLEHFFEYKNYHHHDDHEADHSDVITFLQAHYGESDHDHSDGHHDLPFKHDSKNSCVTSLLELFFAKPFSIEPGKCEKITNLPAMGRTPAFKSSYLQTIWQPPKIS
jgi:hypothetical protein